VIAQDSDPDSPLPPLSWLLFLRSFPVRLLQPLAYVASGWLRLREDADVVDVDVGADVDVFP
jgi:hypothetical protein